jgi:hypothetical protein
MEETCSGCPAVSWCMLSGRGLAMTRMDAMEFAEGFLIGVQDCPAGKQRAGVAERAGRDRAFTRSTAATQTT